jgi:hypothetical protein
MTKTISFIELCELVKTGKQPEKIYVHGSGEYKWEIDGYYWDGKEMLDSHTLNNLVKECKIRYEDSILTEKEKAYLSAVVAPFKDKQVHIHKSVCEVDQEYIAIYVGGETVFLPCYDKGDYYRGMDVGYDYSLEELGI